MTSSPISRSARDNETGNLCRRQLPPAKHSRLCVNEDLNENASLDSSESAIGNVTITLTGTDDAGTRSRSRPARQRRFVPVPESDAREPMRWPRPNPSRVLFRRTRHRRSAGGLAGNDQITGITIAAGTAGASYLFGELPPADPVGYVYIRCQQQRSARSGRAADSGLSLITVTGTDEPGTTGLAHRYDRPARLLPIAVPASRARYRINGGTTGRVHLTGWSRTCTPAAIVGNDTSLALRLPGANLPATTISE